jgi:hypothetical protein
MPPPIRYPLPTLILLVMLGLVAWRGGAWFRGAREAIAARWHRVVEGPPIPVSTTPKVVAGAIVRQGILLRDGTPVATRPGSKPTDAIGRRVFVDIYDVWPTTGTPTHYRVGTRSPIGWVAATDCLEWDTRLVVRPAGRRLDLSDTPGGSALVVEVGTVPLPVLAWDGDSIEVAVWDRDRPWSGMARRGWTRIDAIEPDAFGVLLAQTELPALLALSISSADAAGRDRSRLRALLGRLVQPVDWSETDVEKARAALPARAFRRTPGAKPSERIATLNARPEVDASWSGQSFRFLPLDDLP